MLPPPGADPGRLRRPTYDVERASLIGAVALGLPSWILGGVLLTRHYRSLPPDGFKGLGYRVDLCAIVFVGALAGAVIGAALSLSRSPDAELRRPRVLLSMAAFALVLVLVLAPFGLFAGLLGGPGVIGIAAMAVPALALRWGARIGYPSVLGSEARRPGV